MIGSVFVLIGSYSILLLGAAAGGLERLLFFVTAFLFSLFPTLLSTADTLSSGEGATVLQFLGASGRTITAAVLAAILGAGASGMIVGVFSVSSSRTFSAHRASGTLSVSYRTS